MPYTLLPKAILFAVEKHDGDYRDGDFGLPYSTHPIEVCSLLRYVGNVTDEDLLCSAILHDVIEETSTTPAEIEKKFGKRIGALVVELTRTEPPPAQIEEMDKAAIWQLRSSLLLEDISKMSADAQSVKLADRLANLRQAKMTRKGEKLKRYERQSKKILEIIPKNVNSALWMAIQSEL